VVGTRLLLALPVLLALALASTSPAPEAAARPAPAAPTAAPPAPPPAPSPPVGHPPGSHAEDECTCTQHLVWEECEPAWHHDQQQEDPAPRWRRRPVPGSQDGPI
jgi:hypothetical protein